MPLSFLKLRQHAHDSIADYPALKLAAQQVAAQILHGSHGQKKAGGSETFWQFREYNEIDRPQDIDWRQSAKEEHVFVREKELHTPQSVYLWSKNDAAMDFQSKGALYSKAQAAQILGLAMAMVFQRSDERVGVLGAGRAGHSDAAIERVGTALLEPSSSALPDASIPSRSGVVLCSDFLDDVDAIDNAFAPLSAKTRQGIVIQVLDRAELDLPYDGRPVFEDAQMTDHKVDNVESIRETYQKRVRGHIAAVGKLCEGAGWMHALHVTDRPLSETMLGIWEGMQQ